MKTMLLLILFTALFIASAPMMARADTPQNRYDVAMQRCEDAKRDYNDKVLQSQVDATSNFFMGAVKNIGLDMDRKMRDNRCKQAENAERQYNEMSSLIDLKLIQNENYSLCDVKTQDCEPKLKELLKLDESILNAWIKASATNEMTFSANGVSYNAATGDRLLKEEI